MEFIIVFLIIFSLSASLAIKLNKKIDKIIPIVVLGIILLVYLFGIFEYLDIGIFIIVIISILALCYLLKKVIISIKEKKAKELINNIITPGLIVYTILYIAFIIINHRAIFTHHDEFSHWGIVIKNLAINHSLGMNEESIVKYSEYPPFTAIFQYIFLFFKGSYSESTIITASNILYLSIIITIMKNINWGKELKKLIIYIPIILFLPMICFIDFYKTILVDGILGILFLYVIYVWYTEDDDRLKKIGVTLGCCSLVLVKLSGIGLSIIAFLIGAVYIFRNKENRKKELKSLAIMLAVITLCIASWQIKLNITKAPQKWNLNNININNIIDIPTNKQNVKIIKNYANNVLKEKVITDKNISTLVFLLIIIAYSIFEIIQIKEIDEKKKYRYYSIALLLSCVIYIIGLLATYLFIIPKYEAPQIPCFDRYMGTILLQLIMFHIIMTIERIQNIKKWQLAILVIFLLVILPINSIAMKIVNWSEEDTKEIEEREKYAGLEKYKNVLTEDDKIYFAGNGTIEIYQARLVSNYIVMPTKIGNTEIYTTGALSLFKDILKDGQYTYIYIFSATEKYKEKFKEFFENEEIKNNTLYKIEEDGIFYEVNI